MQKFSIRIVSKDGQDIATCPVNSIEEALDGAAALQAVWPSAIIVVGLA